MSAREKPWGQWEWTPAEVIGDNVKNRREALGLTAAAVGEKIGELTGKAWPRQTVYQVESGNRAMVADEVVALAHVLNTTVPQLFIPPARVEEVHIGGVEGPAVPRSVVDPDTWRERTPPDVHEQLGAYLRPLTEAHEAVEDALKEQAITEYRLNKAAWILAGMIPNRSLADVTTESSSPSATGPHGDGDDDAPPTA